MDFIVWGVIAVLAIAAFVAAYFSARNWHWANVTVGVLLFLSTILFVVLSAKVVQIRAVYGRRYNKAQVELEDYLERNRALQNGVRGNSQLLSKLAANDIRIPEGADEIQGIVDLNHQLHLATRIRGRVWRNAAPAGAVDPETGVLAVSVPFPTPHGIDPNTIVFVFEQGEPFSPEQNAPRQYLGEFRVIEAAEGGIRMQPVLQMDPLAVQRLQSSPGSWAIHETMPVDRHELFTGPDGQRLPEERLGQMLPPQSVQEYIRHGSPATPDDDEWHRAAFDDTGRRLGPDDPQDAPGVEVRYDRALRDYANLFHKLVQQRIELLADGEAVTQDIRRLNEALASAKELTAYRDGERAKLSVDLAGVTKERKAIEHHLAVISRLRDNAGQLLEQTVRENSRLAQQIGASGG